MATGQGRRKAATEYLFVAIDLLCERGHRVGKVWKDTPPAPPPFKLHLSSVEWVDTPKGGLVKGSCSKCGAQPQWRWDRILERLNGNEETGQHTDAMKP